MSVSSSIFGLFVFWGFGDFFVYMVWLGFFAYDTIF